MLRVTVCEPHRPPVASELDLERVLIGSAPSCDVRVMSTGVMLVHAEVLRRGPVYNVVDRSEGRMLVGGGVSKLEQIYPGASVTIGFRGGVVSVALESLRPMDRGVRIGEAPGPWKASDQQPKRFDDMPREHGPGGLVSAILTDAHGLQECALDALRGITLGRSTGCEWQVASEAAGISGRHVKLQLRSGWLVVEDLNSTYGTWIDGRNVGIAVLPPGEHLIVLGSAQVTLLVRITPVQGVKRATKLGVGAPVSGSKESRDTERWVDLPAAPGGETAPRKNSVLAAALALMESNPGGATLLEIKAAFEKMGMGHHDPRQLLVWASKNRGWGFEIDRATGRVRAVTATSSNAASGRPLRPDRALAALERARAERQRVEAAEPERAGAEQLAHQQAVERELADNQERQRTEAEQRHKAEAEEHQRAATAQQLRAEAAERHRAEDVRQRLADAAERERAETAERHRSEVAERQRAEAERDAAAERQRLEVVEQRRRAEAAEHERQQLAREQLAHEQIALRAEQSRLSAALAEQRERSAREQHAFEELERRRDEARQRMEQDLERESERQERMRGTAAQLDEQRRLLEEERLLFQEERRRFELERQQSVREALPTDLMPTVAEPVEDGLEWLLQLPAEVRLVFRHLAAYGQISEDEATRMLGGARQFRQLSSRFDTYRTIIPFLVRVETASGSKAYVRVR